MSGCLTAPEIDALLSGDSSLEEEARAYEPVSPRLADEFRRKVRIFAANFHALPLLGWCLWHPRGPATFFLWSHKVVRWFTPLFLLLTMVGTAGLWTLPFFAALCVVQVLAWALAAVILLLRWRGWRVGAPAGHNQHHHPQ